MKQQMINDLITAAKIFGIGWGGIFIVMILLYAVIKILLKLFPTKNKN